jgi:hypothetical protein
MFGIAPGNGSVTITAANGDTLSFDYIGELNAITGEGLGTFIFTGGTGRFTGATGNGTFRALINVNLAANQPMTVVLNGRIRYWAGFNGKVQFEISNQLGEYFKLH